ncbi:ABC transporter permease [Conexibacter stalactiti]|uniref:Transport permease protein n=1 Tax=Conexibacter stalactiti TaxID=1940611 RepID=A0ABU4HZB2_9ACTN|nr:ABC transporter permease [Conexibacter stalactiti]MDW5598558.1 ABC transporter permease [Conexibacter stalactiti]MEC5039200.1 ABC transporter permease [Conexibacter stalactiti]
MSTVPSTTADEATVGSTDALRRAIASGPRPPRASVLTACRAFAWRGMLKIRHVPEQLIDATLTPVLFTLMFTYMFGGAIAGSTSEYLQFILPGILVQSVLFTTVYSGVALNTDMTRGVVDRFRSLPLWRPAPLVGSVAGDSVRYLIAGGVVIVLGLILGFDPEGGVLGVLAALALVILFAFGLAWVFTTLGLVMRSPNAVMNTGFMALFPLVFLSNTFVDTDTLPNVLAAFVDVNPVTHLVTAARGLMHGDASGGEVLLVLGETAALTAIFVPLTTRLYRKG